MQQFHRHRINRIYQYAGIRKVVSEKELSHYQSREIETQIVLLYAKYILNIRCEPGERINYRDIVLAICNRYNVSVRFVDVIDDLEIHEVNTLIIDVVDKYEFNDSRLDSLSHTKFKSQLKYYYGNNWYSEDKIEKLLAKYQGLEDELLEVFEDYFIPKQLSNDVHIKSSEKIPDIYPTNRIEKVDKEGDVQGKNSERKTEEGIKDTKPEKKVEKPLVQKEENQVRSTTTTTQAEPEIPKPEPKKVEQPKKASEVVSWKGLQVPIIQAKTIEEARKKAEQSIDQLPIYKEKNRAVYFWNGKPYSVKPVAKKKAKAKKESRPVNWGLINALASVLIIVGIAVTYYLIFGFGLPDFANKLIGKDSASKEDIEKPVNPEENEKEVTNSVVVAGKEGKKDEEIVAEDIMEGAIEEEMVEDEKIEEIEEAPKEPKPVNVENRKESIPVTMKQPASLKYHVIAGSFTDDKNCRKLFQKLKRENYQPQYLGKIGPYYKVSYFSYTTREEAVQKRGELLNRGVTTWIQEYTLN